MNFGSHLPTYSSVQIQEYLTVPLVLCNQSKSISIQSLQISEKMIKGVFFQALLYNKINFDFIIRDKK